MQKPWRLSFEFFPPKTTEGLQKLLQQANLLATCKPDFFSVTFGAGGSTKQGTLETAECLQREIGIDIAPHLSCVGLGKEELQTILKQYYDLGFHRIVALRGDYPEGDMLNSELQSARELIQLIRQEHLTHFHIETAAYPECHPKSDSIQADIENLKQKIAVGANSAITQYFFNADAYYYYLEECTKQHVCLPIIPGIMPITQFDKLIKFSQLCGAEIPRWLHKRLAHYANDSISLKAFGIELVSRLCENLLAYGAPGLHFYTLNQAESSLAIVGNL